MPRLQNEPHLATIEVLNDQCNGLKVIKELGVRQCNLVDVRNLPNGLTRHLISFPSSEAYTIPKERSHEITVSHKKGKETFLWFDTDGCHVCKTILETNCFLVSGKKLEGNTILYSFVAPTPAALKKVLVKLEDSGLKSNIIEAGKYQPKTKLLTEKQDRVLWLALKMGFFNYPRRVHTSELAQRLGIKPSTLSEILRRGTRRLLEDHYKS